MGLLIWAQQICTQYAGANIAQCKHCTMHIYPRRKGIRTHNKWLGKQPPGPVIHMSKIFRDLPVYMFLYGYALILAKEIVDIFTAWTLHNIYVQHFSGAV